MDFLLSRFMSSNLTPTAARLATQGAAAQMPSKQHHSARKTLFLTAGYIVQVCLVTLIPLTALAETPASIDMKMLVVSADGNEPSFAAIKSILDQVGVPYDTLIATQTPLTAQKLSDGTGKGYYQGILLSTGNLGYQNPSTGNYESAFTAAQWQLLQQYETAFRVRQATLYTYPAGLPDNYGLNVVSGNGSPVQATLTATGKQVFNYLNPNTPVTFKNTWTYFATPASTSNPVPLLTTAEGYAIASVYTYPDGRQNLTITSDSNPFLTHTLELGYGIINWVSKGFFLGERKVYMNAQVDDVLIPEVMWDPSALSDQSGITYRMNGNDYRKAVTWQNTLNASHPNATQLRLEMGFNGIGATTESSDTLTSAVKTGQNAFKWISHTYDHDLLNDIGYAEALDTLQLNHMVAGQLGLQQYFKDSLIQPEISGLNNPTFLLAAKDFGLRYILSNTSVAGGGNPSPNAGFYSPFEPSILVIPRRPTNLYYNVSTPQQWTSEYNYFYAPRGLFPTWDHALSYQEVLDKESEMMLQYLLKYDLDSLMFHQSNLRAYSGSQSLLGDLIKATIAKYNALFNLPVRSPSQHNIGILMANRMAYNASGVAGTLLLGTTNTIALKTTKPVTVPLTGIIYGGDKEVYGGQTISTVKLSANGMVTIPAPAW